MRKGGWILLLSVALVACGNTPPQRPIIRGAKVIDTATVQMLTINQHLAEQADLQLAHMADEGYVCMDENYWVKGLYSQRSNLPCLQEGEYIDFKADFYSLTGQLLATHQSSVQLGRVDDIQAIGLVLKHMQHAQSVSMLVPWYMAFGSTGNSDISPYENIRIELSVQ